MLARNALDIFFGAVDFALALFAVAFIGISLLASVRSITCLRFRKPTDATRTTSGTTLRMRSLTMWEPVAYGAHLLGIQILEGYVLAPKIQGETLDLPAILVLLAILIGGELAGIEQ